MTTIMTKEEFMHSEMYENIKSLPKHLCPDCINRAPLRSLLTRLKSADSLILPANRHEMKGLVMFSLFLVSPGMARNLFSDVSVCTTEQCEVAALRLNENMNISIDSSGLKRK